MTHLVPCLQDDDSLLTALICTRNRPADAVRAAASVLASENAEFELIIVDQSDNADTTDALYDLADPRLRVIRSETRGLGAALDQGLRLARSDLVIHTDDDCVVPPDWLARMAKVLSSRPEVALVFGNVVAADHDSGSGYIPTYVSRSTLAIRSPFETVRGRGIGASVAFKKSAVLEVGGVDAQMGAGSKFKSCEDWDIELRVLLAGWTVVHIADVAVVHSGYRSFTDGRRHARSDWHGIGACVAKCGRHGRRTILPLGVYLFVIEALMPPVKDIFHLRRPRGLQRIVGFCTGFASGWMAPVDKKTVRFL